MTIPLHKYYRQYKHSCQLTLSAALGHFFIQTPQLSQLIISLGQMIFFSQYVWVFISATLPINLSNKLKLYSLYYFLIPLLFSFQTVPISIFCVGLFIATGGFFYLKKCFSDKLSISTTLPLFFYYRNNLSFSKHSTAFPYIKTSDSFIIKINILYIISNLLQKSPNWALK